MRKQFVRLLDTLSIPSHIDISTARELPVSRVSIVVCLHRGLTHNSPAAWSSARPFR